MGAIWPLDLILKFDDDSKYKLLEDYREVYLPEVMSISQSAFS
jgi:hypothetical protein